jgi:hypothetical protein
VKTGRTTASGLRFGTQYDGEVKSSRLTGNIAGLLKTLNQHNGPLKVSADVC